MKQQHYIYLALGIAATILFYVLRVQAYEAIYSVPGFSDQFYNAGLYEMIPSSPSQCHGPQRPSITSSSIRCGSTVGITGSWLGASQLC